MTLPTTEVCPLSAGAFIWHRYDSEVKADLFSTALATASGIYLVDPISLDPNSFSLATRDQKISGIVVTNANHCRAAHNFAAQFSAPIYASAETAISSAIQIADGEQLTPELTVSAIEGAAQGELALYWKGDGGTLVLGDALINFGSHEFTFLPAKYCSNPKLMRKSLRKLLAYSFERILFAHGTPIVTKARSRLAALLNDTP